MYFLSLNRSKNLNVEIYWNSKCSFWNFFNWQREDGILNQSVWRVRNTVYCKLWCSGKAFKICQHLVDKCPCLKTANSPNETGCLTGQVFPNIHDVCSLTARKLFPKNSCQGFGKETYRGSHPSTEGCVPITKVHLPQLSRSIDDGKFVPPTARTS